jgi:thiamine-phosphate diphosphorylase
VRPVTCMITDRHRLAGPGEDRWLSSIAAAVAAGVDLVQIRERDLDGAPLLHLTRRAVACVRGTRTRVLVNDRVDVALAGCAHGVQLRGDSMPAARVRAIAPPGFLVGRSIHSEEEAVHAWRAGGVDFVVFGHVFPTSSKAGREPAGCAALRRVVGATPLPVLALGGITADRFDDVAWSGAAGFAAIGLFAGATGDALRETLVTARRAFSDHEVRGLRRADPPSADALRD